MSETFLNLFQDDSSVFIHILRVSLSTTSHHILFSLSVPLLFPVGYQSRYILHHIWLLLHALRSVRINVWHLIISMKHLVVVSSLICISISIFCLKISIVFSFYSSISVYETLCKTETVIRRLIGIAENVYQKLKDVSREKQHLIKNKVKTAKLAINIRIPLRQWMLDNLLTDKEVNSDNRYVLL